MLIGPLAKMHRVSCTSGMGVMTLKADLPDLSILSFSFTRASQPQVTFVGPGCRSVLTWNSSWSQTSNILLRLIDISDASGTTVISSDAGDITGETVIGNAGSNSHVGVTSDGNIIVSYTKNTGNTFVQTFDVNGNIATAEQDIGSNQIDVMLGNGQWLSLIRESKNITNFR